jgi:hypothetical protein
MLRRIFLVGATLAIASPASGEDRGRFPPGAEVVLYRESTGGAGPDRDGRGPIPLARQYFVYSQMTKSIQAHDTEGMEELYRSGLAVRGEAGDRVRILKWHNFSFMDRGDSDCYEIRLLSGAHAGKTAYVRDFEVEPSLEAGDLAHAPPEPPRRVVRRRPPPPPPPRFPDRKAPPKTAASSLLVARALEPMNTRGAIAAYAAILKDFPASKEAAEAKERFEALSAIPRYLMQGRP